MAPVGQIFLLKIKESNQEKKSGHKVSESEFDVSLSLSMLHERSSGQQYGSVANNPPSAS